MDRFAELAKANGILAEKALKLHDRAMEIVDLMKHAVLMNIELAVRADELLYEMPQNPGLDGQRFRDLVGWTDLNEVRYLLANSVMPIGTSPSSSVINGLAEIHQLRLVDRGAEADDEDSR